MGIIYKKLLNMSIITKKQNISKRNKSHLFIMEVTK